MRLRSKKAPDRLPDPIELVAPEEKPDPDAEDNHRQRSQDLIARLITLENDRDEGQGRGERGHENRYEPFHRPLHDGLVHGYSFLRHQVLVVIDQQDAVANGNPEQRDEPNKARDRDDRGDVTSNAEQGRGVGNRVGRL